MCARTCYLHWMFLFTFIWITLLDDDVQYTQEWSHVLLIRKARGDVVQSRLHTMFVGMLDLVTSRQSPHVRQDAACMNLDMAIKCKVKVFFRFLAILRRSVPLNEVELRWEQCILMKTPSSARCA